MAHPRYPAQPGYIYSGGYYPVPLPAQYPPNYYYPYNVVGYTAGPVPPSPRVIPRRKLRLRSSLTSATADQKKNSGSVSPRPVVVLHPILTSARNRMAHWSVTEEPRLARTNPHTNGPELIHPSTLAEPATTPELHRMTLVSDDFPWTINLAVPSSQFVSVGQVLGAIHGSLQEPLSHDEWDELSRNSKTNAHRSRCVRLARMPARYAMPEDALAIRRVDSLAEKTVFLGMKGLGDLENPSEWNVRLGHVVDRDHRRR